MAQSLNELTNQAQLLKAQGRIGEAIDMFKAMFEANPNNVAVMHNYAAMLGDAGDNRTAIKILDGAFRMGLNAPESWLVYARALAGVQEFEKAEKAFVVLLSLKPLDHEAHREFAQLIWMQTGDREKAIARLNRAIEVNPDTAGLHVARAQVFGQTGDREAEYTVMREIADRSADPYLDYHACNSALLAGAYDQALVYGEKAAAALRENNGAVAAYCQALLAVGDAKGAGIVANYLRQRDPFNQLFIALEATGWRMTDDERYHAIYDFDGFIHAEELSTPEGWGSLDAYLDDLCGALDEAHQYKSHPFFQSVRGGSQISSINGADNRAMRAFGEAADGPVRAYIDKIGSGSDPLRSRNIGNYRMFSCWSILLPPNGYHVNHVHPQGWLSSACHLRACTPDSENERAGWLKFGEPGVQTNPDLPAERYIQPKRGVMVVFPSYMWHGTMDFHQGGSRLTIAADLTPAPKAP